MNIELRFLQKAIKERNCISFIYENKKISRIKPLNLSLEKEHYILYTNHSNFIYEKMKKIEVLKEKY